MEQLDWRRLIEALRRGRCILVTGPQVAVDPRRHESEVLPKTLARALAAEVSGDNPHLCDPDSLPHVAQLFCDGYNRSRMDLEFKVDDFLRPFADRTTPLHRELARLPFKLCISTTPDRFLYNAFVDTPDKQPVEDHYNFRRLRDPDMAEPSVAKPLVFHLYGSLQEPESLVLTENELLDFLVNVVTRDPPLQPLVGKHLADPENSFLFLGFGFDQWYVRILLHILQVHGHKQPSLALEAGGFLSDPAQRKTVVFFQRECQFAFRELSLDEFGSELRKRFIEQAGQERAVPAVLPDDAPVVFLCYRSEDEDQVASVEQALHGLGINTWRDAQNLRGGDDWHRVIHDVLSKQVDYVLVLQTHSMVNSVRTYCHREIDVALDTQTEYGDFRFLIPATLEACQGFDKLSRLQTIDLTAADGLERLAQTIKEDWHARHERKAGQHVA